MSTDLEKTRFSFPVVVFFFLFFHATPRSRLRLVAVLEARESDREMSSASPSARFARAVALALLVASLLSPRAHAEIHGAFAHGVASGDPTSDSIIIWTRVTPVGRDQPGDRDPTFDDAFEVTWTVATKPPWRSPREGARAFLPVEGHDDDHASSDVGGGSYPGVVEDAFDRGWHEGSVAKTGVVAAVAARDWTVKIDVRGLESNVRYYYAFEVGASAANEGKKNETDGDASPVASRARRATTSSPTGTFALPPPRGTPYPARTVDTPSPPLKFAVFSCANWAFGHFHAYDAAAKGWGEELAAWLHLGDYYYEYGEDNYPNREESVAERWSSLRPRNETWTLADYRARHALYRTDAALRRLHAAAPVIAMWDDHEIANNPWTRGGENHQPEREGAFAARARAAVRAYHEWLPTREPAGNPFAYNRTAHFGDVVSFVVLETRLTARTDPSGNPAGDVFANLTERFARNPLSPSRWAGSALESELRRMASALDAYRGRDDKRMLGAEQTRWVAAEARRSRDAGVAWQAFAQASPVMNGKSPDVERAADALDAAKTRAPPGAHASWRAALRAWTAYDDDAGRQSSEGAFGVGGRSVVVAAARALLALGTYGINWDFDDWRGYVAERARFLNAVASSSNRALVLGGDSHDAWAGVVPGDRGTWGVASEAEHPENPTSYFDAAAAAEFDAPGVTPPGAFEQAFPWVPSALIDEGHRVANRGTMRYARTGNRGFLLVSVDKTTARGDFFFVPSVRERTYVPECGASFEVREAGRGRTVAPPSGGDDDAGDDSDDDDHRETPFRGAKLLRMTDAACPALPESLFSGSDAPGYAGAVQRRGGAARGDPAVSFGLGAVLATALACALAGGVVGYRFPKKRRASAAAWKYETVAESDDPPGADAPSLSLPPRAGREGAGSTRGNAAIARELELGAV